MANALTTTLGANGANSASYVTSAGSGGGDTIANAQLKASSLPATSRLRAFLSATYADAAAVNAAWANLGGSITGTNTSDFTWVATASTPSLAVTTVAAAPCTFRMSLTYSMSA